ncbi:MAG: hypothetical protein H6736_15310 [Alphaproteobacteria bacterium]|nr:hypothetical protein [Alphaproteobacteria bacterium]
MSLVIGGLALAGCPGAPPSPTPPAPVPVDPGICERFQQAFAPVETSWSGSVDTCDPGMPSEALNAAIVEQVRFVRELVDLPAARAIDPAGAAGCALLLEANGALSHEPPPEWACWESGRADAAGRSLLATVAGPDAVRAFLIDPGNDLLGHRRWLLSDWVQGIAFASTDGFSCLDMDAPVTPGGGWTPWPPAGETPVPLLELAQFDVDRTGWSIQSDTLDLTGTTVRLTWDGVEQILATTPLQGGLGSVYGVSFTPETLVPNGVTWTVEVLGAPEPITYSGRKVACQEPG